MPDSPVLRELGYSPRWQGLFKPYAEAGLVAARVIRSDRGGALIVTPDGVMRAKFSRRLLKSTSGAADLPAVGDWVAVPVAADPDIPLIEAVLERASVLTRGNPGNVTDIQVLAANIDTVFVVHPIAEPPNLRRIERELSLAWDSGASPVVVLTKLDLSADPDAARAAVEAIAPGADVLVTNALAGDGVQPLLAYISGHRTAVLVGPSGAGKSTLINALLGEQRQATREVRVIDGRGRHTTVTRELIQMPGGGVLIDTPGLRALGLTGSEEGIAAVFPDIERYAGACRFRDCTHIREPEHVDLHGPTEIPGQRGYYSCDFPIVRHIDVDDREEGTKIEIIREETLVIPFDDYIRWTIAPDKSLRQITVNCKFNEIVHPKLWIFGIQRGTSADYRPKKPRNSEKKCTVTEWKGWMLPYHGFIIGWN